MRLGILSDIHESVESLGSALDAFKDEGVDRIIVLGDVFETGERIGEAVELLVAADVVGVWGNHDYALCQDPPDDFRGRFGGRVLDFMGTLRPRLEVEGCLFTHVEPWLDPTKLEDLWWFEGAPETPERLAQSFGAVPHRVMFAGHLHRWLLGTPEGVQPWRGEGPIRLDPASRHLVVVHAVCEGHAALYDTQSHRLCPLDLDGGSRSCRT